MAVTNLLVHAKHGSLCRGIALAAPGTGNRRVLNHILHSLHLTIPKGPVMPLSPLRAERFSLNTFQSLDVGKILLGLMRTNYSHGASASKLNEPHQNQNNKQNQSYIFLYKYSSTNIITLK